jgi:hypothetical protein
MQKAMSDEFGTVNLRRTDRSREIEVLQRHRESLVKMLADVDQQIRELELSSPNPPPPRIPPAQPGAQPPSGPQHPARRGLEDTPLVTTPDYEETTESTPGGGLRVLLIIGAAILGLALIGYLIWRASSDRPAATETVVEETTATVAPPAAEETDTIAPATTAAALAARPQTQDYGLVRKGTRTTRQYEITNNSEEPVSIVVSRSTCRCLYYEHAPVVPPKAKESITVTIDGAKAKAGTLRETIQVTSKSDPATGTSFDVIATVR